jgi:hypothetical protein
MIRVMLFLDPAGGSPITDWEVLGRIDIANNLAASIQTGGKRGTYDCVIYKKRKTPWKRIKLRNFPRESYHPWEMVRQILNNAAEKNGGKI